MSITRMTRKGQITIPKDVRDSLGITEGDYVVVVADGDKAIMSPIHLRKLSELKGILPATRAYPGTGKVRDEVGCDLGDRGR